MLNSKEPEMFEEEVKKQFVDEPAQMKLLIVVDKLLTGFDAHSCHYIYILTKNAGSWTVLGYLPC